MLISEVNKSTDLEMATNFSHPVNKVIYEEKSSTQLQHVWLSQGQGYHTWSAIHWGDYYKAINTHRQTSIRPFYDEGTMVSPTATPRWFIWSNSTLYDILKHPKLLRFTYNVNSRVALIFLGEKLSEQNNLSLAKICKNQQQKNTIICFWQNRKTTFDLKKIF